MDEIHGASHDQFEMPQPDLEGGTLESAEGYIAAGSSPSCPCNDCCKEFQSTFSAFLTWAESLQLIRDESEFDIFGRPCDAQGNEHQVWYIESEARWYKATFPNKFGLAWGRPGTATIREYISRLRLQNRYFGDDVQLLAVANCSRQMRVITSQPHINGEAATFEEIQEWFITLGFARIAYGESAAWYLQQENLLVADAHEGNVIRSSHDLLVPIDLNLVKPTGHLLAFVEQFI